MSVPPPQRAGDAVVLYVGGKPVSLASAQRGSESEGGNEDGLSYGSSRADSAKNSRPLVPVPFPAVPDPAWRLLADVSVDADLPPSVGGVVRLEVDGRDVCLVRVRAGKLTELDKKYWRPYSYCTGDDNRMRMEPDREKTPPQRSGESGLALIDAVCYHAGGPLCRGRASVIRPLQDIEDLRRRSAPDTPSPPSATASDGFRIEASFSNIGSDEVLCLECPWHHYMIDVRSGAGLFRDVSGGWKWKENGIEKQRVHDLVYLDGSLWARLSGRGDPALIVRQDTTNNTARISSTAAAAADAAGSATNGSAVSQQASIQHLVAGPRDVESDRYAYMRLFEHQG